MAASERKAYYDFRCRSPGDGGACQEAKARRRNAEALCVIERSRRPRTTQLYAIRACKLAQHSSQKQHTRPLLRNGHAKSVYCMRVRIAHRQTASDNQKIERAARRPPPSPARQNRLEGVTILETPGPDDGFIDSIRISCWGADCSVLCCFPGEGSGGRLVRWCGATSRPEPFQN